MPKWERQRVDQSNFFPDLSRQGFIPRLAVALSALQFSKRTLPKAEEPAEKASSPESVET